MPIMITRRQIDEGRDTPRPAPAPTPSRVVSGSPVKSTRTGTAQSPATPPSPVGGRVTVTVTPSVTGSGGSGTGQPSGARSSSTRANTGYTPTNGRLMGNLGIHMGPTTNVGFGAEAAVYSMARNDISAENFLYANTKDKADDGDWRFGSPKTNGKEERINPKANEQSQTQCVIYIVNGTQFTICSPEGELQPLLPDSISALQRRCERGDEGACDELLRLCLEGENNACDALERSASIPYLSEKCRSGVDEICAMLLNLCNQGLRGACRGRSRCTQERENELNAIKDAACNQAPTGCNRNMTCAELLERIWANQACIGARWAVVNECYQETADDGHEEAIRNAENALFRCQYFYVDSNCPPDTSIEDH